MKIALLGYGRMGKAVERIGLKEGHQFPLKIDALNAKELTAESLATCDVAIEFSNADSVVRHLSLCIETKTPVVCGTTGWLEHQETVDNDCKEKQGTMLCASNFSVGVHLFFATATYLSKCMGVQKNTYRAHIQEIHHMHKRDKPSGTAIELARRVVDKHPNYTQWKLSEMGEHSKELLLAIESLREGEKIGEHTLCFSSDIDEIKLTHHSNNRDGFAKGALLAADYIIDKVGIFTMEDVLGLYI